MQNGAVVCFELNERKMVTLLWNGIWSHVFWSGVEILICFLCGDTWQLCYDEKTLPLYACHDRRRDLSYRSCRFSRILCSWVMNCDWQMTVATKRTAHNYRCPPAPLTPKCLFENSIQTALKETSYHVKIENLQLCSVVGHFLNVY